jgi:hypothetical protein
MPIYEYTCQKCEGLTEMILTISAMEEQDETGKEKCQCGGELKHTPAASGQYCGNNEASWLRDAVDVADKDSGCLATREFIKNPTRRNHRAWMEAQGLRPLEDGEKFRPDGPNEAKIMDHVIRKHKERMSDSEYRRYTERRQKDGANLNY